MGVRLLVRIRRGEDDCAHGEVVRERVDVLDEPRAQSGGLARVDEEEELSTTSARKQERDRLGELVGGELVLVAKLEESVTSVPGQVDEHAIARATLQTPQRRRARGHLIGQYAEERLDSHLRTTIVDPDVRWIQILFACEAVEHAAARRIALIARVPREHEHDLAIRHAPLAQRLIHRERTRCMTIIVKVARR